MSLPPATARATLFFEPLDVLHFRDHRPFDAGLHTHARSVFPLPSVLLGCLRTALLTRAGARFDRDDFDLKELWARSLLGTKSCPGTLSLRGPFLARRDSNHSIEVFLPRPYELRPGSERLPMQLEPRARRYHGAKAAPVTGPVPWTPPEAPKCDEEGKREAEPKPEPKAKVDSPLYLRIDHAHQYLKGLAPTCFVREDEIFRREPRVGIVRSEQRLTAEDHLLYSTEPFRFAERAGLAVEVEMPQDEQARAALTALHHAIVPLGGKGHRARVHYVSQPLLPQAPTEPSPSYKLWLVTPLILGAAPWPAEVTCVASGRPVPVGGFDLAKRAPKPLRHALPAGTVLRISDSDLPPERALKCLTGADASPSHWLHDRRAGFGVALVAKEAP